MPSALAQVAATVDNQSRLWVIGGWDGNTVSAAIKIYDPTAGTWSAGPSLPTAVRDATALYFNNQILVFGGFSESSGSQIHSVQIYDLGTSSWSSASFSAGGWALNGTVVNNQILLFGGEALTTAANRFDPTARTFTSLASLPFNSIGGRSVTVGSKVYLVAGAISGYTAGTQFAVYDPAANSWSTTIAQLPAAVTQFAAASDGKYVYVAGGSDTAYNANTPLYNTLYAYDPGSDTWLTGPALPAYVREASGILLGNQFLVIGGIASSTGGAGSYSNAIYTFQVIPEPPDYALLALGLAVLGIRRGCRWWRRKLA